MGAWYRGLRNRFTETVVSRNHYAYECKPEIVKLMIIQLKSITAQPSSASQAVQKPLSFTFMRV
jgi:hypothetical protein